jgi:hypothetical protein
MLHIRPSLPGDTWLILPNVREEERFELEAIGISPEVCLRYGILYGEASTVFLDEEPAGVFGTMEYDTHRVPWGVFTPAIERHPLPFLRECKRWAARLRGPAINYVDARNPAALKWFAFMGFEVSEAFPYGIKGEPFHQVRVN